MVLLRRNVSSRRGHKRKINPADKQETPRPNTHIFFSSDEAETSTKYVLSQEPYSA